MAIAYLHLGFVITPTIVEIGRTNMDVSMENRKETHKQIDNCCDIYFSISIFSFLFEHLNETIFKIYFSIQKKINKCAHKFFFDFSQQTLEFESFFSLEAGLPMKKKNTNIGHLGDSGHLDVAVWVAHDERSLLFFYLI